MGFPLLSTNRRYSETIVCRLNSTPPEAWILDVMAKPDLADYRRRAEVALLDGQLVADKCEQVAAGPRPQPAPAERHPSAGTSEQEIGASPATAPEVRSAVEALARGKAEAAATARCSSSAAAAGASTSRTVRVAAEERRTFAVGTDRRDNASVLLHIRGSDPTEPIPPDARIVALGRVQRSSKSYTTEAGPRSRRQTRESSTIGRHRCPR